jgi:hypothetical protein
MTLPLHSRSLLLLGFALSLALAGCSGDDDASSGAGGSTGATGSGPSGGATTGGGTTDPSEARFFDHRHTALDQIPASCIDQLKSADFVFHYAHRSHGAQIIVGADSLAAANPTYGFESEYCSVPSQTGVLRMWDGMTNDNLVVADDYWATDAGLTELRTVLGANPSLRYSSWAWSFEISSHTEAQVQQYLDTLAALELEFPDVTFIYMTGTAQEEYNAANRVARNKQIRDFARAGGKALFDFEDLDVWYNGERHTEVIEGTEVTREHPQYRVADDNGYESTHTTQESCENKARAFWWMMARLEGCQLP